MQMIFQSILSELMVESLVTSKLDGEADLPAAPEPMARL